MNGLNLSRKRTPRLERWSNAASVVLMKLENWLPVVTLFYVLTLIALATLLTGCATQSPPDAWPKNPTVPQLSEPIPSETYSQRAEKNIRSWLDALTGM